MWLKGQQPRLKMLITHVNKFSWHQKFTYLLRWLKDIACFYECPKFTFVITPKFLIQIVEAIIQDKSEKSSRNFELRLKKGSQTIWTKFWVEIGLWKSVSYQYSQPYNIPPVTRPISSCQYAPSSKVFLFSKFHFHLHFYIHIISSCFIYSNIRNKILHVCLQFKLIHIFLYFLQFLCFLLCHPANLSLERICQDKMVFLSKHNQSFSPRSSNKKP